VRRTQAVALAIALITASAEARELSAREQLAREIYEQLIETDTTQSTGSTTRAAEAMAKRLRAAGVPERDVHVLGPERKGNLVARLRARGEPKQKPLLLLAHLDVVEAKFALQAAEKTSMNFELVARDKGGHSSRPAPGNAIYRLAAALGRVDALAFPAQLNEVTRAYFERLARIESGANARAMAAIAKNPRDDAAANQLAAHPTYNATLRTTCVATQISGGHAPNALPQEARALVNCRALPGHEQADVERALVAAVADASIEVTATRKRESSAPARVDAKFLATVTRISNAMWPGVPVIPTMGTGATDSTYFRLAGIPAYGVSGLFDDIDDYRAHGRDERLGVAQFYDGLEFLRRLVHELAVRD